MTPSDADEPPSDTALMLCTDADCGVAWAYRDPPAEHYHPRPHGPALPDEPVWVAAIDDTGDRAAVRAVLARRRWREQQQ